MIIPTSPSLASCSLPSSTLRAGCAGGLWPCLTELRATPRENQVGAEKRSYQSNRETFTGGQFLMSPGGQFLMSLDTTSMSFAI